MLIRPQSEIRMQPIDDPVKITVVIGRADLQRLKMAAVELNTTVNEIMRVLAADWLDGLEAPKNALPDDGAEFVEKKYFPHM